MRLVEVENDPYQQLAEELKVHYRGLDLIVGMRLPDDFYGLLMPVKGYERYPGGVTVNTLIVPRHCRGRGVGTTVMRQLCAMADERGHVMQVPVLKNPKERGYSYERTCRFYAGFGFVPSGDPDSLWFVRLPHALASGGQD